MAKPDNDEGQIGEFYTEHDLTEGAEDAEWTERPGSAVMVVTSLRVPKPIMDRVRAAANARGMKPTALMREWIEAAVADGDTSVPVSMLLAAAARHQTQRAS